MKVFLSRKAKKALHQIPSEMRNRIERKISELFETPYPAGCRKLSGAPNAYRLRVGNYRILYSIVSAHEIVVFKIVPRETVY